MKRATSYILASYLLLLLACTKELPYPDLNADDVLVMNALLSPEDGAAVHLSRSCHVADTNCAQNSVSDATVVIKDEAGVQLAELIHQADGFYSDNSFEIFPETNYTVEVSSTALENINAQTYTPSAFSSTLVGFDEKKIASYLCRSFEIEIADNPNETNYYLIDGWVDILNGSHEQVNLELNGFLVPHTGFVSNDINIDNNEMVSSVDIVVYPLEYIFLTDENFNGTNYLLEFGLFESDILYDKDLELEAHIRVRSVSEELYGYYKSVTNYKLTVANILAEPQQILSNVEGGIGILGGFTQNEFVVELPQTEYYLPQSIDISNNGCTGPCAVSFDADMGDELTFSWDFGDGSTSLERNPTHEYTSAGTYQVELTIFLGIETIVYSEMVEIF